MLCITVTFLFKWFFVVLCQIVIYPVFIFLLLSPILYQNLEWLHFNLSHNWQLITFPPACARTALLAHFWHQLQLVVFIEIWLKENLLTSPWSSHYSLGYQKGCCLDNLNPFIYSAVSNSSLPILSKKNADVFSKLFALYSIGKCFF